MRIPTYDQRVVPKAQDTEVFSLPGEKETVRRIPTTGVAKAKAESRYHSVMFDIGGKIADAQDADAVADAQKQAFEEFTRIDEIYKNPENQSPTITGKDGKVSPNPNYLPPDKYHEFYQNESAAVRDRILKEFKGRPRAKTAVKRFLDDTTNRHRVKVNAHHRGKVVADMTESFYKRLDENLENAAVLYNKDPGNKQALTQLFAMTEADIASAVESGIVSAGQGNALLKSVKAKAIDAVMKTDINKAFNHGLDQRNTDQLDEVIKGLSKPSTDKGHPDYLTENQRIDYKVMAERMRMSLEGKIDRLNKEEAELFLNKSEEDLENAMVEYNDRSNIHSVKTFASEFNRKVNGYVEKGVMSEAKGQSVKKDFQRRAVYGIELSNIYLAYQAGSDKIAGVGDGIYTEGDKKKDIEGIDKLINRLETPKKLDHMTENQRVDLLFKAMAYKSKLEGQQNQRDMLVRKQLAEGGQAQIAHYEKTGEALNDEKTYEERVRAEFGNKNKVSDAYMHDYKIATNNAKIKYSVGESIKSEPIAVLADPDFIDEQIKKFRPQDRPQAAQAMRTAINAKATALKNDPVQYVNSQNDSVKSAKALLDAVDETTTPEDAKKLQDDYFQESIFAQEQQGVPDANVRVMDNTTAQSVVMGFVGGSEDKVIAAADAMEATYGDNYDRAYRDLQRAKLPDGLQIVLSSNTKDQRNLRLEAAGAYKMKDDEFGSIDNDTKDDIDEALRANPLLQEFRASVIAQGGGSADSMRRINSLESAIRKLGMYKAVKNNDTDNASMYVEKAVEEVIGANYTFTDQGYRVPSGVPVEEVEIQSRTLATNFPMELLNEKYPYPDELSKKIRTRGLWVTNKTDDGINLVVDGVKIIDKDDKPINIPFDNLDRYKSFIPVGADIGFTDDVGATGLATGLRKRTAKAAEAGIKKEAKRKKKEFEAKLLKEQRIREEDMIRKSRGEL